MFTLTDTEAAAPTLSPGTVTATQGLHPDKVVLTLTGWASTPGAERTYQVRARTRFGEGEVGEAAGRRQAGPVTLTWERSAGAGPQDFAPITGASGSVSTATYEDSDSTGIPPFGVVRHYRARLEAEGATAVTTESVAGWRTPLPGAPQIASVSTTVTTHVEVGWSPIWGATAYHVYRDGVRVTPPIGVTCQTDPCAFIDDGATAPAAWQPPTDVSASTDRTTGVTVTWTLPSPPATTSHRYEISVLNLAGESARSPEVIGWRGFPALSGVEVLATTAQAQTFTLGAQATSFDHDTAPHASFSAVTLTASQGDYRAHVALELEGGALGQSPEVTYEVRGIYTGGTTPRSTAVVGRRATGSVSRAWEYASIEQPDLWIGLPTAACSDDDSTCVDNTASPLGTERHYRTTLSAAGAETLISAATRSSRLAFAYVSGSMDSMCAIDTMGRLWVWGRYRDFGGGNPDESVWYGTLLPRLRDNGPFGACTVGGMVGQPPAAMIPLAFGCGYRGSGAPRCGSFLDDAPLMEMTALGSGVRSLRVGVAAACAVVENGEARCWGAGSQLGDLVGQNSSVPVPVRLVSGDRLSGLAEVSVGGSHACARDSDGRLWCWGDNSFGQTGDAIPGAYLYASEVPGLSGATSLALGGLHSCVVSAGQVLCFGHNLVGQFGNGTDTNSATPTPALLSTSPDLPLTGALGLVTVGSATCARRTQDVRCWGDGWDGRLGDGTFDNAATLPRLVLDIEATSHLGGGGSTICAIVEGSIWCWGANHLGDGTTAPRATPGEVTLP